MPAQAIHINSLSKRYQIGHREAQRSFREALYDVFQSPVREFRRLSGREDETNDFWALKDVSFEVRPGEVVGIIGRNGAGKSTLLKILSQITEPTAGRIEINGRVASLLEVGTGFHPELTGRENIFLNGSILGMSRNEIRSKFDEIVDFSGVESFLDTPIKRYSSGMQVRLAFAVAAHLEPEILIIDEVLAVGDAGFQDRCLKKMNSVASGGRTVLFVSHQMQAITSLCDTVVELANGQIANSGPAREVVGSYLAGISSGLSRMTWQSSDAPGDESVRLRGVCIDSASCEPASICHSDQPINVVLDFECSEVPSTLCIGFDLFTADGTHVLRSYQSDIPVPPTLRIGMNRLTCVIPAGLLNGGMYRIAPRIGLHNIKWCVHEDCLIQFQVTLSHGQSPFWNSLSGKDRGGTVAPILEWFGNCN